ncbi:MAG: phosphate propanoyltransferase [candidate division KSB1 bacterium]|jgi:putative phosphotransacetylase|nr:phosphate propanoyltransferase [candidate division KSB1 bacterium]
MSDCKGIASYCQECGACEVSTGNGKDLSDPNLIEMIVDEVVRTIHGETAGDKTDSALPLIPLGVSNRHIHLTQETFEKLFGAGADLERYRDLYQPGDIAAKQTLTIVGSKLRAIPNVRILGPLRNYDQVELSLTDAVTLGINPPIRNSGDLKGAAPLTLVGPKGSVYLEECAIIAIRHMHVPGDIAKQFGVEDGDYCKVRISGKKSTIFENVLVRINDAWKLQLHLDTDDANAANVRCDTKVEFMGKMQADIGS